MRSIGLRLGLVQINVTDLREAWQFYVDKLGLHGVEKLGRNKAFHLELENGPPILIYPVPQRADRRYPDDTGVTLVFYTSDIRKTVEIWKKKGVEFIGISWSREASGIAETPFGQFIAFRDPFCNVHELLQPS